MSETANEVEIEETCWCTITLLVSIIIAAFSYRFFGPENPETSTKKAPEPAREVYVQVIHAFHSRTCNRFSTVVFYDMTLMDLFRKSNEKSQNRQKLNR